MQKSEKVLLKDQIYSSVLNDIIEGVYKRTDILNEKQLIEKYGVSKSPVRDALIELCKDGVLYSHPRYGYEIVSINDRELEDIINFRLILEPSCMYQAAEWMCKDQYADLMEFTRMECRTMVEASIWDHWKNNMKFHLKLNSYCKNAYCYQELEKCMNIMTRAYAQKHWERWKKLSFCIDCEEHINIVKWLEEGNVDKAAEALKRDIRSFETLLKRAEWF